MSMIETNTNEVTDHRRIVAHSRRRILLDRLIEADTLPLDTLVDQITATESSHHVSVDEAALRDQVHISLVHNHLPRLIDYRYIEYDPDEKLVQFTAKGRSLVESGVFDRPHPV